MRRAFLTLALALPLLAACQLSLLGRDRPMAEANPITGGTITTTPLDAAPTASATPTAPAAAVPPTPEADPAQSASEIAAPAEATPAISEPLKSASQIACEEDGGTWARAGAGGGMSCVRQTRDGGKQCDSKTECQGECLARSRTCAPIQPLFGCNAVLMDNGAEVSLCID
ncbi:MAG: hypothetical protein O9289_06285 [Rhodobacteraceae bacterium]|nr:hypothetical protein [Paracoccaceae bacterium]MCZ8082795.1 hypothetical protein [Paracoccaceae bacterium]